MKQVFIIVLIAASYFVACKNNDAKNANSSEKIYSPALIQLMGNVSKHPDSIGLRFLLVDALDSAGFYKEALSHMDSLIMKDSLNYGFWYKKGNIQQDAKDTTGAITSFKRAIRVYSSPDALLSLANLYAEKGNDSCLSLCIDVERINPDRKYAADCSFITGVYYARTKKTKQAIDKFDECINNSHTYMVAYMERGFILYETKQYTDALKTFILATEVNNRYADAYYWQGKCYEAMNNKTEAINNYEKSLTLDKTIKEAEDAVKRLNKQ